MNWLERLFTRRDHRACFAPVPARAVPRLRPVLDALEGSERQAQARLGLRVQPRMTLVDEEMGRIVTPAARPARGAGEGGR